MLSIPEIEILARRLINSSSRLSLRYLVFIVGLSVKREWCAPGVLSEELGLKKINSTAQFLEPIRDFSILEFKKENGQYFVKISDRAHFINQGDYDYPNTKHLMDMITGYTQRNNKASCFVALVLIAIFIRKLNTTKEIKAFAGVGFNSMDHHFNNLSQMGLIEMVKYDDYRNAPVYVFPIEQ